MIRRTHLQEWELVPISPHLLATFHTFFKPLHHCGTLSFNHLCLYATHLCFPTFQFLHIHITALVTFS